MDKSVRCDVCKKNIKKGIQDGCETPNFLWLTDCGTEEKAALEVTEVKMLRFSLGVMRMDRIVHQRDSAY